MQSNCNFKCRTEIKEYILQPRIKNVARGGQYRVQKYRCTILRYFFSTDTDTHGTFSKMIPKYWYRGTFSKKIWYFQVFVISNGLKIKLSLSLWSGANKFLTPKYTLAARAMVTSLHSHFRIFYDDDHDDIIKKYLVFLVFYHLSVENQTISFSLEWSY